ncbi:hypothetical protein [Nocardia puris]|uniref:Uncharacterized protein n=1 Tax=Nocardia puris TaxID=208602 RepID=A0A366CWS4_9NOCA|nr:hypothetical protein [Nocardia puris]RBO79931.1 hypothetical protein DFR74_1297 [Nocardia puris]
MTLVVTAPSEAAVRKMLASDDFGQELQPRAGTVPLTSGGALPHSTLLAPLSFRKVWAVLHVLDENGRIARGSVQPGDGPVAELESLCKQEYCAAGDRLNLLDDGKGRDRYCGSCADTRSADEHSR